MERIEKSLDKLNGTLQKFLKSNAGTTQPKESPKQETSLPAELTVRLPEGAVLYVNGVRFNNNGRTVRSFRTPLLAPGRRYSYALQVEYEADGVVRRASRRVIVEPGAVTTVDMRQPELVETVAQD